MQNNDTLNNLLNEQKKPSWLDKLFLYVSLGILYIPLIRSFYLSSFSITCKLINTLIVNNKIETAYRVLIYCLNLRKYRTKKNSKNWWFLLRIAIACLQQEQLQKFLIRPVVEDTLMELGNKTPHEKKGYDASYCFVGFALWQFERGLTKLAVKNAEVACQAFDLWGYPDYLIGWFNLFNKQTNSIDYFCKAVEKDWAMLHRIRHDPTCKMFPNIVKEVSQRVLVAGDKKLGTR